VAAMKPVRSAEVQTVLGIVAHKTRVNLRAVAAANQREWTVSSLYMALAARYPDG